MEFGKVSAEEIQSINFTLPGDGQQTLKVLNGTPVKGLGVFVGGAKWGLPEWVNFLYPPKTKAADFLSEYAAQLNSIELNAAYYKIPTVETVRKWKEQATGRAKGQFLFCPKFPDSISHYKRLKGVERITDDFLTSVVEFEETLGPCFLQLSDNFKPDNLPSLDEFLQSLPKDLNVFVELRNKEWFADLKIRKTVFELLAAQKKGAIITDVSGRRDALHMEVTIPEVFVRFVGNGVAHREHNFARIDAWAERLATWQQRGLKKVYFFLHQQDERESVVMADYAIKAFNKTLGSNIPEINLPDDLFS